MGTPPPPPPEDPKAREPLKLNLFKGRDIKLPPSLASLSGRLEKEPSERKAAWRIGTLLVLTFAASCIFVIWEGFRVIFYSMDQPEHTKTLITLAVIPFLEKVGTFLTTVFGPLLAFILGYYFGQKSEPNKNS